MEPAGMVEPDWLRTSTSRLRAFAVPPRRPAWTKAVVAMEVSLSPKVAVGAVGLPVRAALLKPGKAMVWTLALGNVMEVLPYCVKPDVEPA